MPIHNDEFTYGPLSRPDSNPNSKTTSFKLVRRRESITAKEVVDWHVKNSHLDSAKVIAGVYEAIDDICRKD